MRFTRSWGCRLHFFCGCWRKYYLTEKLAYSFGLMQNRILLNFSHSTPDASVKPIVPFHPRGRVDPFGMIQGVLLIVASVCGARTVFSAAECGAFHSGTKKNKKRITKHDTSFTNINILYLIFVSMFDKHRRKASSQFLWDSLRNRPHLV